MSVHEFDGGAIDLATVVLIEPIRPILNLGLWGKVRGWVYEIERDGDLMNVTVLVRSTDPVLSRVQFEQDRKKLVQAWSEFCAARNTGLISLPPRVLQVG